MVYDVRMKFRGGVVHAQVGPQAMIYRGLSWSGFLVLCVSRFWVSGGGRDLPWSWCKLVQENARCVVTAYSPIPFI